MQEMPWLETHLGSIDEAINLLKDFTWEMKIVENCNRWYVMDGEAVVFSADSREAVDTFVYGMALAYASVPEPYHGQLLKDMKQWKASL